MSATITERPYTYVYSKNEIRYIFNIDDLSPTGLFLQVKILYKKMDDVSFTELFTFEGLKPDTSGNVYVYIQAYINSVLNYVMPAIGSSATDASDQVCKFYVQFRLVSDADPDPEWDDSEAESSVRIAIKGGIEFHKASRNNIFVNYLEPLKPFLTWQPSARFVFNDEPIHLSFLNTNLAGFKIKVVAVATDGTTITHLFDHSSDTKILYHLFVSSEFLTLQTLLGTGKSVYYYDVSIVATDGTTVLINAYRFYIEYRTIYEPFDLYYHNSLGGVDVVRVSGEIGVSYARTTTEGEQGLNINEWNAEVRTGQKTFASAIVQRNYKGNVSSLKTRTKQQQEAFLELLVSKSIYMNIGAWLVPVIITQTTIDLGSRKNNTDGFDLTWQLSESNEVYTPVKKLFGFGS